METVVMIVMLVGSCSGQTIVGVSPLQRAGRGTTAVLQCTVKLRPDTRSLDLGWAAPSGETVASLVTTADLATRSEVWIEESCQRNFAVVITIFREDAFSENFIFREISLTLVLRRVSATSWRRGRGGTRWSGASSWRMCGTRTPASTAARSVRGQRHEILLRSPQQDIIITLHHSAHNKILFKVRVKIAKKFCSRTLINHYIVL